MRVQRPDQIGDKDETALQHRNDERLAQLARGNRARQSIDAGCDRLRAEERRDLI